jgi:hypothetical protein
MQLQLKRGVSGVSSSSAEQHCIAFHWVRVSHAAVEGVTLSFSSGVVPKRALFFIGGVSSCVAVPMPCNSMCISMQLLLGCSSATRQFISKDKARLLRSARISKYLNASQGR